MAAPSINLQRLQFDLMKVALDPACPAAVKNAIEQSAGSPVVLAVAVVDAAEGLEDEELSALPEDIRGPIRQACEAVAAYRFWGRQDKALALVQRIDATTPAA